MAGEVSEVLGERQTAALASHGESTGRFDFEHPRERCADLLDNRRLESAGDLYLVSAARNEYFNIEPGKRIAAGSAQSVEHWCLQQRFAMGLPGSRPAATRLPRTS